MHLSGAHVIGLKDFKQAAEALGQTQVVNREERFNPSAEVSVHPIWAARQNLFAAAVPEPINPAVPKEPAHNAADGNVVTDAWNSVDEADGRDIDAADLEGQGRIAGS